MKTRRPPKVGTLKLSEAELMCRMVEAVTGEKRPERTTTKQAIEALPDKDMQGDFTRAARAAILQVMEQIEATAVTTVDKGRDRAVVSGGTVAIH
jgi:hypothetical protein